MSPYPAQVNRDEIIDRAREIIETEGLDRLTLQHLATALGIQAPSLYRHVGSKNELLRAVNEITIASLIETVLSAANTEAPTGERVKRMATAYRTFAQQYPVTYHLAFSALSPELRPDPQALESLVRQVEMLLAELTGEAASATALRGLLAGESSAYRDAVLLNAAAALVVAGRAGDLKTGAGLARESIDTGDARACAERLAILTRAAAEPDA